MSLFVKKIGLVLLTLLLLSGCAKKLPPQINEGKAFSKQPYVVQGNLRYSIEDFRSGLMKGDEPAESEFLSIKILVENIGPGHEEIDAKNILFLHKNRAYPILETRPTGISNTTLTPKQKLSAWLIFNVKERPIGEKYLAIKENKIEIEQ